MIFRSSNNFAYEIATKKVSTVIYATYSISVLAQSLSSSQARLKIQSTALVDNFHLVNNARYLVGFNLQKN